MARIVGLDPSLRFLGISTLDTSLSSPDRLRTALVETGKLDWRPAVLILGRAIRQYLTGSDFVVVESEIMIIGRNRSNMQLSKVNGVLAFLIGELGIPCLYVTPQQLRKFAGCTVPGKIKALIMPNDSRSDHEVDALFLTLIGAAYKGIVSVDNTPSAVEKRELLTRLTLWTPTAEPGMDLSIPARHQSKKAKS